MPTHRSRLEAEVRHLQQQRDSLQQANTREVRRRRRLEEAVRYALKHVPGHSGIPVPLQRALDYDGSDD